MDTGKRKCLSFKFSILHMKKGKRRTKYVGVSVISRHSHKCPKCFTDVSSSDPAVLLLFASSSYCALFKFEVKNCPSSSPQASSISKASASPVETEETVSNLNVAATKTKRALRSRRLGFHPFFVCAHCRNVVLVAFA